LEEFDKARLQLKNELASARSRIHISFDLWTSPNSQAMVGVVGHYLGRDYRVHSTLIALRRILASHTGENIAEAIKPVLQEYEIVAKLGVL
jgi:hypothetical protein